MEYLNTNIAICHLCHFTVILLGTNEKVDGLVITMQWRTRRQGRQVCSFFQIIP